MLEVDCVQGAGQQGTYHAQIHHGNLADMDHVLDISASFHESHLATPRDLSQEIPRN